MSLSARLKFVIYSFGAIAAGRVIQHEQRANNLGLRGQTHNFSHVSIGLASPLRMRKRGIPIVAPVFLALNFDLLWDTFDTSISDLSGALTPADAKRQKLDIALLEAAEKSIEDDMGNEKPDDKQRELNTVLKQIFELRKLEQKEEYTKRINFGDKEAMLALKQEVWSFFAKNPAIKDKTRQLFYEVLDNSSDQMFEEDVGLKDYHMEAQLNNQD